MKIRLCLATTAAVLLMAAVSFPAQATLIPYTFSPDASMTFTVGTTSDVIHFTGGFTVDTTLGTLQAVSVTASCTGPLCPGPLFNDPTIYTDGFFSFPPSTANININIPTDGFADIAVASTLTIPGTHDLVASNSDGPSAVDQQLATSVSGDVAAIPEPSSLALLTSVLGLFLLTRRAHRPNRAA